MAQQDHICGDDEDDDGDGDFDFEDDDNNNYDDDEEEEEDDDDDDDDDIDNRGQLVTRPVLTNDRIRNGDACPDCTSHTVLYLCSTPSL